MELLLEPFQYAYMLKAIWASSLVGAVCAFLSAFLMLKGWSLMGDALSHSVVPGVAGAYALGLPYSIGAFFSGLLAALSIALIRHFNQLKEDAIIGLVFSSFFAAGLLIISLNPTSVNVQSIIFGNILAIDEGDLLQVHLIILVSLLLLLLLWKDLLVTFFDEVHARSIGLSPLRLKIIFFTILSACTVAAMQTVGAILVIAMVITPGATAYLLTSHFPRLLILSVVIGTLTCAVGAWLSYFIDGATGGVIICLQTLVFLLVLFMAPKQGLLTLAWQRHRHKIHYQPLQIGDKNPPHSHHSKGKL